jgi:hypothetical protein
VAFRAVVADCAYGDVDDLRAELRQAGLGWVVAVRPRRGTWAYGDQAHTPRDAARALAWKGPDDPGDWRPIQRRFRDGHTATWWAAEARLGWWGPDQATRLVVATTDPHALPDKATWYLATNLPRPGSRAQTDAPHPAAGLAEILYLYGLRHWVEQSYKQIKDEIGWADFQVRSAIAIRRHQTLVNCAFSFCWDTWFTAPPPPAPAPAALQERGHPRPAPPTPLLPADLTSPHLAPRAPRRPQLADPRDHARALVENLVHSGPTR